MIYKFFRYGIIGCKISHNFECMMQYLYVSTFVIEKHYFTLLVLTEFCMMCVFVQHTHTEHECVNFQIVVLVQDVINLPHYVSWHISLYTDIFDFAQA